MQSLKKDKEGEENIALTNRQKFLSRGRLICCAFHILICVLHNDKKFYIFFQENRTISGISDHPSTKFFAIFL